jgi:hypothetical protein
MDGEDDLTDRLLAFTIDDTGTPVCKPLVKTPSRDEGTALVEHIRSLKSRDEKKVEP